MKVRITFEFDSEDRAAIAVYYGNLKPASRATCVTWVESVVDATLTELHHDLEKLRQYALEDLEAKQESGL